MELLQENPLLSSTDYPGVPLMPAALSSQTKSIKAVLASILPESTFKLVQRKVFQEIESAGKVGCTTGSAAVSNQPNHMGTYA